MSGILKIGILGHRRKAIYEALIQLNFPISILNLNEQKQICSQLLAHADSVILSYDSSNHLSYSGISKLLELFYNNGIHCFVICWGESIKECDLSITLYNAVSASIPKNGDISQSLKTIFSQIIDNSSLSKFKDLNSTSLSTITENPELDDNSSTTIVTSPSTTPIKLDFQPPQGKKNVEVPSNEKVSFYAQDLIIRLSHQEIFGILPLI